MEIGIHYPPRYYVASYIAADYGKYYYIADNRSPVRGVGGRVGSDVYNDGAAARAARAARAAAAKVTAWGYAARKAADRGDLARADRCREGEHAPDPHASDSMTT